MAFLLSRAVKKCTIKTFMWRGEGRQGCGSGGGDSERCLKWGGGVRGGFTNLSRNMRWVMAKVVFRGDKGYHHPYPLLKF